MKKINTLIFALLAGACLAVSCGKDFLNIPDKTIIEGELYIKDLETTSQYLNGIYTALANYYAGIRCIYSELVADNIKPVIGSAALRPHYRWLQEADEGYYSDINMNAYYRQGYLIIHSCNRVVQKATEYHQENADKADLLKGQALAIRSLIYFELVNIFAQSYNFSTDASHPGIPYTVSPDWTLNNKRETVHEIYARIQEDLSTAIALLHGKNATKIYMNEQMAKGLLSKIYLFMEDYENAKNAARNVSDVIPIMQAPAYPGKLFTPEESEALFQLPPESKTYTTYYAGTYFVASPTGFLLLFNAGNDIAEILKEDVNDTRSAWVTGTPYNWYITKFPTGVVGSISVPASSYYLTIMRSSETHLIAAESYAKLNNADSARFFLNMIRKRANPLSEPVTVSGTQLLDSIYKERRKELAFEGGRIFDLLRWKKEVRRSDADEPDASFLPYPSNRIIAPIPQRDVTISGLTQNLDY